MLDTTSVDINLLVFTFMNSEFPFLLFLFTTDIHMLSREFSLSLQVRTFDKTQFLSLVKKLNLAMHDWSRLVIRKRFAYTVSLLDKDVFQSRFSTLSYLSIKSRRKKLKSFLRLWPSRLITRSLSVFDIFRY